jgi:rhodanese-related sulfurtransferase
MKKLILLLSACIALPILAVATPTIYVAEPVYNFGSVSDGFAIIHTFVLENRGDQALTILSITAQCGCTTTGLRTPHTIDPGDSVELEARVNTVSFGGHTISKTISVNSNDPETPRLTLEIAGQVIAASAIRIGAVDAMYYLYALIDLRSADEYQAHHLVGAVNIAAEKLVEFVSGLPHDTIVILYDTAFQISEAATLTLRREGFDFAYALVGGLNEWVHEYGMKYVTNATTDYELPPRVDYPYETGVETPYKLASELDSEFCLFVDLRSSDEYEAAHILGAVNLPFEEQDSWIETLPRSAVLVFYDRLGATSDLAAQRMINSGVENARSLAGGLDEWTAQYDRSYLITDASTLDDDKDGGQ